jgi:two-component system CheB/CheR fusion protein
MAMTALEQSEQRFRTLVEGMPQLVWRAMDGGKWTWCSPQWSEYTGQSPEASNLMGWLGMFHPEDRQRIMAAWATASEFQLLEFQARLFHDGEARYRHFHTRALPVRDDTGRGVEWLGTSTDIDDIVQLQARQTVLVTELQHRTRNLLAVIQAIVRRTIKDSTSMAAFRECFDDRLMALARVQGLLSRREAGQRVSFDQLLHGELSAHLSLDGSENKNRVSIEGPAGVPLRSATVQTLALALHELTTNAVKYGALSQHEGRLRVAWQVVASSDGDERLQVDWRESGVADMPDAGAPARGGGYGRELIERALPHQLGAKTSYALEPDGVHCTIEVAIPAPEPPREITHA